MSVLELYHSVRLHWQAFRQTIWPEDTRQLTAAAITRLTDELARRYARLLQRRRRIERLRDRLALHEQRLDAMPESLPLLQAIAGHRDRLARLEDAYARQHLVFARRKKLHKALLSGQVVVCPAPRALDEDPT